MIDLKVFSRISILALVIFLRSARADYKLDLVQVVFRHGERTPRAEEIYPKDRYGVSTYEPLGLGQLTNLGKTREFRIGEMLRKRYDKFLGDAFRATDIYGVSTEIDRTKMSLQLVFAGLYPPSKQQTWNKNLPWLPIPVNYVPKNLDIVLRPQVCPEYTQELEKVRKSPEMLKKASAFNNLYKLLNKNTGLQLKGVEDVAELYHLFAAQKSLNLTLPSWIQGDPFKQMEQIVQLDYEARSYNQKLKKFNGGMLIKKFLENMNIKGKRTRVAAEKLYLYSAHEMNIAAVSRAHGFTEPKIPDYGSAIIFEKLLDKNANVYVRILLWTGVTEKTITYTLPGCKEVCPIDTYVQILRDVIPKAKEVGCVWDHVTMKDLKKYLERG